MPGAYAHLTVSNHAQKLARTAPISNDTKYALGAHLRFVELGAVSPDYPYLASGQSLWADHMHYHNTAQVLKSGVTHLRMLRGIERERATAWLFAFASHMATDMTIHPIVQNIVGPYKGNESAHRKCEMHQDTFIFQKMDLGDVGLTEHLKSGIASCHAPNEAGKLDPVVAALWLKILKDAYPTENTLTPDPDKWHSGFAMVLKAVTTANRLFPFSRHVATNLNLTYPELGSVEAKYITKLKTPEAVPMDYEQLFKRACENVLAVWIGLDNALTEKSNEFLDRLENWDLDTGKAVPAGRYVFWKEAA